MEWKKMAQRALEAKIIAGPVELGVAKIVAFFLLLALVVLMVRWFVRLAERHLFNRLPLEEAASARLQRIFRWFLLLMGLLGTLALLGVNLAFVQSFWKVLNFSLFSLGETPISFVSILLFILLISGFVYFSKMLSAVLITRGLAHVRVEEGTKYVLKRVTEYSLMAIGTVLAFQTIGINLSGLAVIFGLLSVGIGFGLQNIASNFISGIILLIERPIQVGDRITVGEIEGDVVEINIRSTMIRSLDNISIIVPNTEFVEGRVINWSHGDLKIRMKVDVGVSYDSDLDTVINALKEVADEHPGVLKSPTPEVLLLEFGDSSWNMQLRVWIANPKNYYTMLSDINCAIVRKFKEKNIEIPFPQRDLHLRSSVPVAFNADKN